MDDKVTGTRNQAKMPENDRVVKVTLEFVIPNNGTKRTDSEWRECIEEEIRFLSQLPSHKLWDAITDYEVTDG